MPPEENTWQWDDPTPEIPLVPHKPAYAIAASARQIRIGDRQEADRARRSAQPWYPIAWGVLDDVGEIGAAITWAASNIAKVQIVPALRREPGRDPVILTREQAPDAWDAIDRLARPWESHYELLQTWAYNWYVTGDCYLLGLDGAGDGSDKEEWWVKSTEEIRSMTGGRFKLLEDETTGKPRDITQQDFLARMWIRHPRRSSWARSNIRSILEPAELVSLISRAVRAMFFQRLFNGIIRVPDELDFGPTDPSQSGDPTEHPFFKQLTETILTSIADPGSAAAAVPIMVKGRGEMLKMLDLLQFDRPIDQHLSDFLQQQIRRLAQGLPVPNEIVLGMGDLNHWTAFKVSKDAWDQHLEPMVIGMMSALTKAYFWPVMDINSPGPDVPIVWYDPSAVIAVPDPGADADKGVELNTISAKAWRRVKNFHEDDAPTPEEHAERAAFRRGAYDPELTTAILRLVTNLDLPERITPAGRTDNTPSPSSSNGNGAYPQETATDTPSPSHTKPVDERLLGSIIGACDSACRRAVERAGSRIRSKVSNNRELSKEISAAPNARVASIIGAASITATGLTDDILLEGAFTDLKPQVTRWLERVAIPSEHIAAAWSQLSADLASFCRGDLYTPADDRDGMISRFVENALTITAAGA